MRALHRHDRKKSTWPPISAILMTAARPASPPPTTMILGFAISSTGSPCSVTGRARLSVLMACAPTGSVGCCGRERNAVRLADPTALITRNSPRHTTRNRCRALSPDVRPQFRGKSQFDTRKCHDAAIRADHMRRELRGLEDFRLHFAERRAGMKMQIHAREPECIGVPHDVGESDPARPTFAPYTSSFPLTDISRCCCRLGTRYKSRKVHETGWVAKFRKAQEM